MGLLSPFHQRERKRCATFLCGHRVQGQGTVLKSGPDCTLVTLLTLMDNWSGMTRFSVGVPEFDDQHRKLAELINQLLDCVGQPAQARRWRMSPKRLLEYASTHFEAEEAFWNGWPPELEGQWRSIRSFAKPWPTPVTTPAVVNSGPARASRLPLVDRPHPPVRHALPALCRRDRPMPEQSERDGCPPSPWLFRAAARLAFQPSLSLIVSPPCSLTVEDFDFPPAPNWIAQHPAPDAPAAASCVAVMRWTDLRFTDLPCYPGDLLVFNDTKVIRVIPASAASQWRQGGGQMLGFERRPPCRG